MLPIIGCMRPTECPECGGPLTFQYSNMYSLGSKNPDRRQGQLFCEACGHRRGHMEKIKEDTLNIQPSAQSPSLTLVKGCARCGKDHEVQFKRLQRMMEVSGHTHWAPCPNTGEPILMKIVPKEFQEHKHRLTYEKPDGARSGVAFKVDDSWAEDPDMFMMILGAGLAALYRHEYEKLFKTSPPATIFRDQFSWGGIPPTSDPELLKKFSEMERTAREARVAFLEKYGPDKMTAVQSMQACPDTKEEE